jgi:hypothetical protein
MMDGWMGGRWLLDDGLWIMGPPFGGHGIMKQGEFKVAPVISPQANCFSVTLQLSCW